MRLNALFGVSLALLCFAPLMRSGRLMSAMLVLEMLGGLLLLLALWTPAPPRRIPLLLKVLLAGMVLLPLVYWLPVPAEWWRQLPGRALYLQSLNALEQAGQSPDLALSLLPQRTLSALLALLPIVGMVLAVLLLPVQRVKWLVYAFLITALVQALLGLFQYGTGTAWAFVWTKASRHLAVGTYANADHFATLMVMALPMALALTAYYAGAGNAGWGSGLNRLSSSHRAGAFFLLGLLVLLAGVFTHSRSGVALLMVAILLVALVFSWHLGGRRSVGVGSVMLVVASAVAADIGLMPVLNRFAVDPLTDVRWQTFEATWQAIGVFFPLGSGPGTFQAVFLGFQPPDLPQFINHVHNDYLEWLFETGAAGLVLLLLGVLVYGYGWWRLRGRAWDAFRFMQTAAGLGLLLMAAHGMVDFVFHTPASSVFFAFLAGVFLHVGGADSAVADGFAEHD